MIFDIYGVTVMDIQVLYYHVNVHNAINYLMYHTCTHVYYCSCLVLAKLEWKMASHHTRHML